MRAGQRITDGSQSAHGVSTVGAQPAGNGRVDARHPPEHHPDADARLRPTAADAGGQPDEMVQSSATLSSPEDVHGARATRLDCIHCNLVLDISRSMM